MIVKIHPDNPQSRSLKLVVECLQDGGVIIYPTDTVYGMGCDIYNQDAVERICRIKQIDPIKANFSFICYDLSHLSDFTKPIDTPLYRVMKKALPGPFTFILSANNNVPKLFKSKKKTVGIRVPDNSISREIVKELGHPIMSTSLPGENANGDLTDPERIHEKYKHIVDIVVDGGKGGVKLSTVVNCADSDIEVVREGKGNIYQYM